MRVDKRSGFSFPLSFDAGTLCDFLAESVGLGRSVARSMRGVVVQAVSMSGMFAAVAAAAADGLLPRRVRFRLGPGVLGADDEMVVVSGRRSCE